MEQVVEREIWGRAEVVFGGCLADEVSIMLESYERKPGKDELLRVTPVLIGEVSYRAFLDALCAKSRKDVRVYDHDWHIELRSGLWLHLVRGLQRQLVVQGHASERLAEDFLAHEIGI
ncbi:hypothetical protein KH389_12850 [Pseudomonas qingdaonensis]|uniref:Uncharacterized protein n=1 Tax=Pseudomonas qingdaonensis TaxID=2056231 RepID=A0ABX8E162_9PSED|nr:hypothetical protein [Pseudomonas qingdaonensis]QVL21414.1 hypothetical protein KH389_12850 [Pseudomonas qingdaonensis]